MRTKIVRYLMKHDSAQEKEISEALGIKEDDVLITLAKLEKEGVIASFLDSEAKK